MRDYLLKLSTVLFAIVIFIIVPFFGIYIYINIPEYSYTIIPWLILIFSETIPIFYILIKLKNRSINISRTKYLIRNTILIAITGNILMLLYAHNYIMILIQIIYIIALFLIFTDVKAIEKIILKKEKGL